MRKFRLLLINDHAVKEKHILKKEQKLKEISYYVCIIYIYTYIYLYIQIYIDR